MKTLFDLKTESQVVKTLSPETAYLVRAKSRSVWLANFLLDEKGELSRIEEAKKLLHTQGYIVGNSSDATLTVHMLKVLTELPSLRHQLKSFGLPVCSPALEILILDTLGAKEKITDRHVIWAVLSALLCPLRQSVGSCFATAPAILVHEEHRGQFLTDMQSLLAKGRLSRIFGGNEYTVPISPSTGNKQSRFSEHPLLKIWEYTVASFVDVKTELSKWNLFLSLGVQSEEIGGIGALISHHLQRKLDDANQKLSKFQIDYEIAFDQARATERLLKNASTEAEGRRLKAEYQARIYHLQSCEEMRDKFHSKANNIASFFPFFIEQMMAQVQNHFQEAYDAEMQEGKGTQYDDSPAGFRLLYKQGRTHAASWTFIHTQKEYQEALRGFFQSIEHPIAEACKWEEGKNEINLIITAVMHHIQTEEFIHSAIERIKKAHGSSNARPWAYISGGTLPTLLSTYFRRESPFSEEARYVTSAQELCIFLLDTLKSLPPRITDLFVRNPDKRMLMTSPTHAFSLLPGQPLFLKGWEDPGFTYTWVRDHYLIPQREFYAKILLKPNEQIYLCKELAKQLPLLEAYELEKGFRIDNRPMKLEEFYTYLPSSAKTDAFLFEMLPLITAENFNIPTEILGRKPFCKYVLSTMAPYQDQDVYESLARSLREKGLCPPPPLLFADTNWSKFYFSFIVHPVTKELELWQTDLHGFTGSPMRDWDFFLNGGVKEPWTVLINPLQY